MKITKKLINRQKLLISPNYVSNGHWLIRRKAIDNDFMLGDPKVAFNADSSIVEDSCLEVAFPAPGNHKRFTKTEWVNSWNKATLFQAGNTGMLINTIYVDGFDLHDLWTPKIGGPCFNAETWEEATVLIMPLSSKNADYRILGHKLNIK